MSVYVLVVGGSVWAIAVALIHWLQQPDGHQQWWPALCAFIWQKLPPAFAAKVEQPLVLAGYSKRQVEEWFGRILFITTLVILSSLSMSNWAFHVGSGVLLLYVWMPYLNAGRQAKKRQQEAVYALPVVMDGLAMLLATGVPLVSALQRNMSKQRSHALQQELQVVLQDIRVGTSLAQALENLCRRLPRPEIRLFANLLLQSSQQGNSLAPLLEQQAIVRREVIAAEIEQYAQEAPVRLLGPLALCIFPATILPFVGVIVAKVSSGL